MSLVDAILVSLVLYYIYILCIFTCICESEEKTRMTGHAKENNLHKNHLMELLNRVVEETKVESKEKVQDYPSKGRGSLWVE